ncbi:MAG: hypothetical protein VX768_11845 [Planctomycetota bacterium]|nr:hypothetical protein [Planctomycetota bacterium]
MHYYIKRGEKIQGPFSPGKVVGFVQSNKVSGNDLVATDELGPFQSVSELLPAIERELANESGASAGAQASAAPTLTCGNCQSPVFQNATSCPKCGSPLQFAQTPLGYENPQGLQTLQPGQIVPPQSIPVNPVQPMQAPIPPTAPPQMPGQYPQTQPGQLPQPEQVPQSQAGQYPQVAPGQYPQAQPGQFQQAQPVPQQYLQPMPGQGYVQGVAPSGSANRPAPNRTKKKRAKKGDDAEINHRLIAIVCGGIGLVVIVILFKFVLTPSLEGKADRLVKRLMTLAIQVQVSGLDRAGDKLDEMEKVGKELDEVLSEMTPEQKQKWKEKWIEKMLEKGLRF